jgi:hypothetical protein
MLTDHDQDIHPRCRRLGHEITFGYCRQETTGQPCRLILDCWWERFDVRSFLAAHLSAEAMARVERTAVSPAPSKMLGLLEMIQAAKDRLAAEKPDERRG